MRQYLFAVLLIACITQMACSTEPITMRHPIRQQIVQCADEQCAAQYEAAGYVRVKKPESE